MVGQSEQARAHSDEPGENSGVPPPAPANWQELLAAMEARMLRAEEESRMYRRQIERLTTDAVAPPVPAPVPVPPAGEVNREPLFERFRKQHPPTFEGSTDPLVAEQWMDLITSTLDFMGVIGNDRVSCASYMLRDDARIWWGVVSQIRDVRAMTWEQFQCLFNEKYFSDVIRSSKMEEFVSLAQGKMTVSEYAQVFDRLSRFAPELVPTDRARRDKFIRGLNGMIARDVGITLSLAETTYAQAVERALYAEKAEERVTKEIAVRREQRKTMQSTSSQDGPDNMKRKSVESSTSGGEKKQKGNWRDYPFCDRCRRYHHGECRPRSCFLCGSRDHLIKDCPQQTREDKKTADTLVPAKMFALTETEARDNKTSSSGKIFFGNFLCTLMLALKMVRSIGFVGCW